MTYGIDRVYWGIWPTVLNKYWDMAYCIEHIYWDVAYCIEHVLWDMAYCTEVDCIAVLQTHFLKYYVIQKVCAHLYIGYPEHLVESKTCFLVYINI